MKRSIYFKNSSYYNGSLYVFTKEDPLPFECLLCSCVVEEPASTFCCNKTFCKKCLDASIGTNTVCPHCNTRNPKGHSNKALDSIVQECEVLCINHPKGCTWIGPLRTEQEHRSGENGCQYQLVTCPRKNCGETCLRMSLSSHMIESCSKRPIKCFRCNTPGEYEHITGRHMDKCDLYPVDCPNACGTVEKVARKNLPHHLASCPEHELPCSFHPIGCQEMVKRKNLKAHLDSAHQQHLRLVSTYWADIQKRYSSLVGCLQDNESLGIVLPQTNTPPLLPWKSLLQQKRENCVNSDTLPLIFKVGNVDQLQSPGATWESKCFFTCSRGYRFHLALQMTSVDGMDFLSCFLFLNEGKYDDSLTWPFSGVIRVIVFNQIVDSSHIGCCLRYNEDASPDVHRRVTGDSPLVGWGFERLMPWSWFIGSEDSAIKYVVDSEAFIEVNYDQC